MFMFHHFCFTDFTKNVFLILNLIRGHSLWYGKMFFKTRMYFLWMYVSGSETSKIYRSQ